MSVPISDADKVIASLRPGFKACYQTALAADPTIQGRVVMDTLVAPDGHVTSVNVHEATSLPPAVTGCIAGLLKDATFAPPGGTGSTLRVPITFKQAGDAGAGTLSP